MAVKIDHEIEVDGKWYALYGTYLPGDDVVLRDVVVLAEDGETPVTDQRVLARLAQLLEERLPA